MLNTVLNTGDAAQTARSTVLNAVNPVLGSGNSALNHGESVLNQGNSVLHAATSALRAGQPMDDPQSQRMRDMVAAWFEAITDCP
jgi:hypothetical protein